MRHTSRPASHRVACTRPLDHSPLQMLEESFLALATAPQPLMLPAHLVCEEPEQDVLPVDQVRTRLAHAATCPALREQTWSEVIRRAQRLGEPWDTVAVAMTVPVLRRMLARLAYPPHLERAEVEQEALAAVAVALPSVNADAADAARELFAAADRAVHRLAYAARRRTERETGQDAAHLGRLAGTAHRTDRAFCHVNVPGAKVGEEGDEYAVLVHAVRARVVGIAEAQLIARTRLGGESMQHLASERGVSVRQLYRRRAAAEQQLAVHLRHQLREQ
ncbi:hypothetical protein [Streptomyces nigrescens]|uniref:Sigma-70 family RNA polymerase sigma factor n=1 Tax=Streptomyces nigrescens TaxID=1920 RepID=A0ABY7J3L2_STRNI|nr:hypothetical protein [Streptomyces nigrescens]WAU04827.1 hypothetical protein STRNI_003133 [Streptomyces nigrescens]